MANLNQMRAEAQRQGAMAPADYPGGPDAWVQDWYQNAVNAGSVPGVIPDASILAGTGASGFNAGDVTAYRNIDPSIVQNMTPEQRAVWSMENIDDLSAHGDRQRSYAQWMEWQKSYDPNCPPGAPYRAEDGSGCVEKPDNSNRPGGPAGGGGAGGGGGGGFGGSSSWAGAGGFGTAGALPLFNAPRFTPPTLADDPGYQFSLKEGIDALEKSAAARGVLRTGGTLKDIAGYATDRAAQQYGDVFNRAATTFGLNYQGAKDEFAPRYGGWQTMYGGDLSRWTTQQNNDLARWSTRFSGDLQRDLSNDRLIGDIVLSGTPAPPVWS